MTTAAEIRKLVKPLLERNPDLVLVGRFVFYKQIGHLIRGIFVDRRSHKPSFYPVWTINLLFSPMKNYDGGPCEDIYPEKGDKWLIDNENIDAKFADRMEKVALPKLQSFKTIEEFSNITYSFCGVILTLRQGSIRKFYIDLALGNFDAADKALELFTRQSECRTKYFYSPEHYDEIMDVVRPLVRAQDKPAIAALLHKWEAYSVKQLKLEKYWQKTPFPIEIDNYS